MALQITSPAGPSVVSVSAKTTPTISHLDMATAGVEYPLSIAAGTKSFKIVAESVSGLDPKLLVSTSIGGTATDDSFPVYPGNYWVEDLLSGSAITFYVSSSKPNSLLKILTWT